MFETYQDIFNQRGAAYHKAMIDYPDARNQEFRLMADLAGPATGETVADLPSGGGYFRNYVPAKGVRFVEVETSSAFHDMHTPADNVRSILCDLENLTLENHSVDVAVSLAGLHHAPELGTIFREIGRVLKPDGRFCLADVRAGSPVDRFLNRFVNRYNSMGHQGEFIDNRFMEQLERSGFRIRSEETVTYTWDFPSVEAMASYVTLMFGLDLATPEQVVAGIQENQGYRLDSDGCRMNWELQFIEGRKTPGQ